MKPNPPFTAVEFILYVKDQFISKEFYRQILFSEPILDVSGITEFYLSDNCKLGLMPEDGIARIITPIMSHPDIGRGIPRCELYLFVEDPDQG